MFLDDIKRKIKKAQNKPEYWDQSRAVALTSKETVIDLIDQVKLVRVKNTGDIPVTIIMNKMHTYLKPQEEKYFNEALGRQIIAYTKTGEGSLFLGQSIRTHTELPKNFMILIFLLLIVSGCVVVHEDTQRFYTPKSPHLANMPKTPKAPNLTKAP